MTTVHISSRSRNLGIYWSNATDIYGDDDFPTTIPMRGTSKECLAELASASRGNGHVGWTARLYVGGRLVTALHDWWDDQYKLNWCATIVQLLDALNTQGDDVEVSDAK